MARKRQSKAEREEWLTRCDLVAAMTAFAVHEVRTLGLEREVSNAMDRVQAEVPALIHDAIDHPEALVLLSFEERGMLALLSDRQDELEAFVRASQRMEGRLIGLNPARVRATLLAIKASAAAAPGDLGGRDGRSALH